MSRFRSEAAPLLESLEHRVLFDSTFDTGYGWKITYPTGVSMQTPTMVNSHLLIHENISDTRSNKPLYFERAPVWSGRTDAEFFALEINAYNNTGGASNKFEMQLVDFGDFNAGPSPLHPRWAHFHTGATKSFSNFSTLQYDQTTATGPMQIIRMSTGSVAAGQTFSLNGGAHPDTGFRIHMGADYPGQNFSLFQALYYDTQPDRFEANDTSTSATNLGTISSRQENNLTLHPIHASSDVDYYKFTASQTGWANVQTLFSHALGNVDMQVLDASQHVLGSGTSTTDNEEVHVNVQAGSTYYVKVFAGPGSSSQRDYSVNVNVTPSSAAPEINLYKFDGTRIPFVSTQVFDLGSVMQGATGGSMQFRVRNDGGGTLTMGLASIPQGIIVDGLASQLSGGQEDVFTIRVNQNAALGTYQGRVGISNNDSDEGTQAHNTFGLNVKGTVIAATARVSGRVFADTNGNGSRGLFENYLSHCRVYYDADRDGRLDAGELVATTDTSGNWTLPNVPVGTNRQIRVAPPGNISPAIIGRWHVSTPVTGLFSLNLLAGQVVTNRLFGIAPF